MPGLSVPNTWLLEYTRFQRNYLWDVLLPDIGIKAGGLIGFGMTQLVRAVQFGDYSMDESNTLRLGSLQSHYAGMFSVPNVRITFVKTMPDAVSAYINAWKSLIVDPATGLFNVKSNYQKTIYIRFLDSTSVALGRYKLIGCFPTKFPMYQMDYENNAVTTVVVEFAVDKVEYEWFG